MFGIGAVAGIAFRILANLDEIMKIWAKIEPLIRNAAGVSGDAKELIEKIMPGVLDKTFRPPDDMLSGGVDDEGDPGFTAKWLQESLNKLTGSKLVVDGDVGEQTRKVIREYQKSRGLEVDGWAGAGTQARIFADLEALERKAAAA
jgi:peptidoglycan hydrolase-like protein with peptidoglycan-binding domain